MSEAKKIGRNDPCPCGSGNKYKNCCYPNRTKAWKTAEPHESPHFTVTPKETPEPITNHLVSPDGGITWKHQPGRLEVQIRGKALKDIDEKIRKIIEPTLHDIDTSSISAAVKKALQERIRNVDHKLHAVKYHLTNYEQAESDKIEELRKNHKPPTGVQQIIEEPRLIYEVEAFLFQVKSCLDVLSQVLEPVFNFGKCLFGEKGDKVINRLKRNCPPSLTLYADNIIKLIEDAQDEWVVELINMRDQITHYSNLEGFDCFIQDPYLGGGTTNIQYPTMPNKHRALEYCQDIRGRLLSFCEDFLKFAVEAEKAKRSG
jgi:hypothetical protein